MHIARRTTVVSEASRLSIKPCIATFGRVLRVHYTPMRASAKSLTAGNFSQSQLRRGTRTVIRAAAAGSSDFKQVYAKSEAASLKAELAALDSNLAQVQGAVDAAEATSRAERQAQAAYEAEIADLTAEISARKQQREAAETAAEAEDVKRMISRVEALKEEAAELTVILTERKDEISGLKRQLAEFEETVEPMRAYANVGLREREAGGDVATVNTPSWDNDWGNIKIPRPSYTAGRRLPEAPTGFAPASAAQQPQPSTANIIRSGTAPGLLLAAGAMGIGNLWNKVKQAFPPEGRPWLNLSAISVMVGAFLYNAYQR